ncbi:hypothetical protein M0Q50_07620 [bacterium]|jgi:hypothetical protein|nr:hypothetical protein [bacterium]
MNLEIINNYNNALEALYEHVGFVEDYVVCPIDDCTEMYWSVDEESVKYAKSIEQYNSDGDYYMDDIYTQRFYSKLVYEGKDSTMVFCDPHTDGVKWFRIFDNTKKIS